MKSIKQKDEKQILKNTKDILDIAGAVKIKTKVKSVLKARNEIHKRYSRV